MTRIRTIGAAYAELKGRDPDTAITLSGLRTLVLRGAIPSVRVGVKYLIDMGAVEAYLTGLRNGGADVALVSV